MKRSVAGALALAFVVSVAGSRAASAQAAGMQCNDFLKLRDAASQRAAAVGAANKRHADRKEICALVTHFVSAEGAMLKFLQDNKTWCGIPDQAINTTKVNHEKSMKFRTAACSEAPEARPRQPTLSGAIGTPSVDTSKNTTTGRGTFDTLTGNPLAR
jgi:hypothetical protein